VEVVEVVVIEAEPRKTQGLRAPLFDRLVDEETASLFYNKEEVIASVERDLKRLLNTRSPLRREEYDMLAENELNFALPEMYGFPEIAFYDNESVSNWGRVSQHCEKVITYFEPRLKNVRVTVKKFAAGEQALTLTIKAILNIDLFQEEVVFPLTLPLSVK
jgi:type VI secretion system protein ImpF